MYLVLQHLRNDEMDLFENKRQKQAEKYQLQELKVQQMRQKLKDADNSFFRDEEEDKVNSILRKDLLVFQAVELKTVFSDDPDLDGNFQFSTFNFK